jgi:hypothetical protein
LKEWDKDFNAFLNEAPGNHMYREGALKIKRECSDMVSFCLFFFSFFFLIFNFTLKTGD